MSAVCTCGTRPSLSTGTYCPECWAPFVAVERITPINDAPVDAAGQATTCPADPTTDAVSPAERDRIVTILKRAEALALALDSARARRKPTPS